MIDFRKNQEEVSFNEIKDGDVFLITEFSNEGSIGKLALRYYNNLVIIGKAGGYSYPGFFEIDVDQLKKRKAIIKIKAI